MNEWTNWSGSLKFKPAAILQPHHEEELAAMVQQAHARGVKVRVAGAGHSSSPLVKTNETLFRLDRFKGIVSVDHQAQTATLRTGMTVHEANSALQEINLALFNTGDVDVQMLAGAIATGTHGSGRQLQNLSSMLTGVRLINNKGEIESYTEMEHPERMKALRVSLGSLGIFTEITVKVLPVFELKRMEFFTDVDTCMAEFDRVADNNRNTDFYWYPRSDETKIRVLNEPGKGSTVFDFNTYCLKSEQGLVGEILPRHRELKFEEMEYALPREAGLACFREVRKRIKDRHRKEVAWRVLYRVIAADDSYLSPHEGRESVSISLHHHAGLPFEAFFNDIEPIFVHHDGRPHWGKKHNLTATNIKTRYPHWNDFLRIRKLMDAEGMFLNEHLKTLLGYEQEK